MLIPTTLRSLTDKKYRDRLSEVGAIFSLTQQIKFIRQGLGLSQEHLALKMGIRNKSRVSQLESSRYWINKSKRDGKKRPTGLPKLSFLFLVAHAFDCALEIRFVPYRRMLEVANEIQPVIPMGWKDGIGFASEYANSLSEMEEDKKEKLEKMEERERRKQNIGLTLEGRLTLDEIHEAQREGWLDEF